MWFGASRKRGGEGKGAHAGQRPAPQREPAERGAAAAPLLSGASGPAPSRDLPQDLHDVVPDPDLDADQAEQLRYTKFMIDGLPGEKHAVIIPDTISLTHQLFSDVCDAIQKDMPTMLISGVSSMRHPAAMTTPQIRHSPAFAEVMAGGRGSAGGPAAEGGSVADLLRRAANGLGLQDGGEFVQEHGARDFSGRGEKELEDFANRIVERRTTGMVAGIANAAQQTNAWIFTGPSISNFEVFLQQAKAHKETEVFCCVAAHVQDPAYMDASQLGPELMKYIFESSTQLRGEAVDEFEPVVLTGDLWNPSKNKANREFHEHGFDYWSFEDEHSAEARGHPVFTWPWPWGDLFFFFYRRDLNSRSPFSVDWNYRTPRMWDMPSIPMELETLAPLGYVFFGGQAHAKKKAMQLMKAGRAMIFMDNTPDVTKQMSVLVRIVGKVLNSDVNGLAPFLSDANCGTLSSQPTISQLLQALSPGKILKYVERQFDSSAMEPGAQLSLSDVMSILDLVRQKPRHFKQKICVLDAIHEYPKDVMPALSSFLCSTGPESVDARISPVQRSLALKGWEKHCSLVRNAAQLRRVTTAMEVLISLLTVAATVAAVIMVYVRLRYDHIHEEVLRGTLTDDQIREMIAQFPYKRISSVLYFWMLVFPISVGVLITLQSHFQFAKKWAAVHLAAHQVATEIHLFLGGAGERYRHGGNAACERFLKQLQNTTTRLTMAGIREEDFAGSDDGSSDSFSSDPSTLSEHVRVHIYGADAENWLVRKLRGIVGIVGIAAFKDMLSEGFPHRIDGTTLLTPLSSETYIEMRVAPLMTSYSRIVREISWMRARLQGTIFFLLAVSTCMVISASIWIPVCLILATTTGALLQWVAPLEMLLAMNNALSALKSINLQWAGSSIWEQRSPEMQEHLISATEAISLAVASTLCRVPIIPDASYAPAEKHETFVAIDGVSTTGGSRSGADDSSRRPSRQFSRGSSRRSSRAPSGTGTPLLPPHRGLLHSRK